MSSSELDERSALVALLRTRPDKMTWPEIVSAVVEAGSASEVWDRFVPSTLFSAADDPIGQAAEDIEQWLSGGLGFATILDEEYPPQAAWDQGVTTRAVLAGVHPAR